MLKNINDKVRSCSSTPLNEPLTKNTLPSEISTIPHQGVFLSIHLSEASFNLEKAKSLLIFAKITPSAATISGASIFSG